MSATVDIAELPPDVQTLDVCQNAEVGVTLCSHCGLRPATKKFCSNVCRQAAYRLSPAHSRWLEKQKSKRLARRNRWVAARFRDKSFTFDGLFGGQMNTTVPRLGEFEKFAAEHHLVLALKDVISASKGEGS